MKKQNTSVQNITNRSRIVVSAANRSRILVSAANRSRIAVSAAICEQLVKGWDFLDHLVIYWACKVAIHDMIDNNSQVYMYFLARLSMQMFAICLSKVATYAKSCINEIPEAGCVVRFCVHQINSLTNLYLVKSVRLSSHEFLGSSEMAKNNDETQKIRYPHAVTHVSYRFYGGLV